MILDSRFLSCTTAYMTLLATLAIAGCSPSESLTITPLENPSQLSSHLPNLSSVSDDVMLSWVHPTTSTPTEDADVRTTHALHTARYSRESGWSSYSTVASGTDWFVNWADFPSVYAAPGGKLAAHWLKRSGDSTYAYDIMTSQSADGVSWSEAQTPHLDGTRTEHGFVSFFSVANQPSLVWLDGRNTESSDNGHADHSEQHGAGAMTLRTRTLTGSEGNLASMSILLDERVCDCCQTAAANTDQGAVVFYRDRSAEEIRDISYVRFDQQARSWSSPKTLNNDGWKINGCPVNGPQADAIGPLVAVAWFTGAPTPRIQLAVSEDSGASFSAPVIVSQLNPLGRVEVVVLSSSRILVSWLEQDEAVATLKSRLLDDKLQTVSSADLATVTADRRSGFPRMAVLDSSEAVIAWTDWTGDKSTVETALITIR